MQTTLIRNLATTGLALVISTTAYAASPRDAVRTQMNSAVIDSGNKCVRTKWHTEDDICAPKVVPPKVAAIPAPVPQRAWAQEDRTVYFDFNRATLSGEAKTKIETLTQVLKTDADVKQARIVGYADRLGQPSYNEQLSRRRAEAVRHYMVSRGFMKAEVAETRWLGEQEPVSQCENSLPREQLIACLQKDRRVEVEIDYLTHGNANE